MLQIQVEITPIILVLLSYQQVMMAVSALLTKWASWRSVGLHVANASVARAALGGAEPVVCCNASAASREHLAGGLPCGARACAPRTLAGLNWLKELVVGLLGERRGRSYRNLTIGP